MSYELPEMDGPYICRSFDHIGRLLRGESHALYIRSLGAWYGVIIGSKNSDERLIAYTTKDMLEFVSLHQLIPLAPVLVDEWGVDL